MELIDKSAVVAEIKKKIRTEQGYSSGEAEFGYRDCAREIEALVDFNPKVINIKDKPYKNTIARMKHDLATTTSSISDKTQPHKQ